jgi:hypothetical protein
MADSPDYPRSIPLTIPDGQVLVHNHVRPARRQGTNGFRFWLQESSHLLKRCDYGWAPEWALHYRVNDVPDHEHRATVALE